MSKLLEGHSEKQNTVQTTLHENNLSYVDFKTCASRYSFSSKKQKVMHEYFILLEQNKMTNRVK